MYCLLLAGVAFKKSGGKSFYALIRGHIGVKLTGKADQLSQHLECLLQFSLTSFFQPGNNEIISDDNFEIVFFQNILNQQPSAMSLFGTGHTAHEAEVDVVIVDIFRNVGVDYVEVVAQPQAEVCVAL